MRRREKGKGSITKTPSGRFKGAIYVTDINGKRKRVSKTCKTRKEVEAWFNKVTARDLKYFSPTTVNEYWEHYLEVKRHQYRESTLNGAINFYNKHVKDNSVGNMQFVDLTPVAINQFFIGLASHGYSTSTISRWRKDFKAVLNMAVYEGYIESNPMALPTALKSIKGRTPRQIHPFTKEEVHKLLLASNLKKLPVIYQTYMLIAFMTGARPQEILALNQSDVTETAISFNKSLGYRGKLQQCMKTESSVRVVPINPKYGRIICGLKKILPDRLFKSSKSANGYVCIDNVNVRFKKYIKAVLGDLNNHHLYDVRHTYASLLITVERADAKTVSKLMGHSNVETTLKYYTHVFDSSCDLVLHI